MKRVFIIATEASGDHLGAGVMESLQSRLGGEVTFAGLGGGEMAKQGLATMFPIDELSIIGISAILKNLPALLARIRQVADAVIAQKPDILVLVDGPEFTHRVAKRVRRAAPHIPIVDYVAPTVWAWRPWRARSMRRYVDHVMAVLPFEPKALKELGGPPTSYVGHPLLERLGELRPSSADLERRRASPPLLLVLPGSRRGELRRLMPVFGETLNRVSRSFGPLEVVLPTLPHLRPMVEEMSASWTVPVRIVEDVESRRQAFRQARAALVKSGTVTLELALAGVPMVAAYQVALIEEAIAHLLVNAPSAILANLVLGENVVPEFLQRRCNPRQLSATLLTVLDDGPARQAQLDAFTRLDAVMETGSRTPRERAADVVMAALRAG